MTGKELKAFAEQVHDDAIIEIREESYRSWSREFQMQAPYVFKCNPSVQAKNTDEETRG